VAGRARRRVRRMDRETDGAGLRALHRHLQGGAAHAWRGRLADETCTRCASPRRSASITAPMGGEPTRTCPVWNAELIRCPQLPTTLPTLDELIGTAASPRTMSPRRCSRRPHRLHESRLRRARVHAPRGTGGNAPDGRLERLLEGWKAQGYQLVTMRTLYESLQALALPRCEAQLGTVPGARNAPGARAASSWPASISPKPSERNPPW